MGVIAQGAVGSALHDMVWTTPERTAPGGARIVTETETVRGVTVTRAGATGENAPAPPTTKFITVPGPTTTTTALGPAATTTVSGKTETVPAPASTVTTTVPGPTTTTTVPGPATTMTVQGAVVTTTVPGPTETVTVTVTEACDPPPKPSNPPCPPHK